MTAAAELLITGKSTIEILRHLDTILEWQRGQDLEVKVIGNDGSWFYDKPSNIRDEVRRDHVAYIENNLLKKGKALKFGGDCNPYIIDDPFMERDLSLEASEHPSRDRFVSSAFKKYRRNSNYTKPKKRNKKRK